MYQQEHTSKYRHTPTNHYIEYILLSVIHHVGHLCSIRLCWRNTAGMNVCVWTLWNFTHTKRVDEIKCTQFFPQFSYNFCSELFKQLFLFHFFFLRLIFEIHCTRRNEFYDFFFFSKKKRWKQAEANLKFYKKNSIFFRAIRKHLFN